MLKGPGRDWAGIYGYLAGLDTFIDTNNRSEHYRGCARRIEKNVEVLLARTGNQQRIKSIKN